MSKASMMSRRRGRLADTASRPSVSGMKSLLPLTLLSPTMSTNTNTNSPTTDERSTFGDFLLPDNPWNLSHPSNVWARHHKQDTHGLGTKVWTQQQFPPGFRHAQYYRDLPIYNEPGSPLGAYFTSRLPSLASSAPETACSEEDQIDEPKEQLQSVASMRYSLEEGSDTLPPMVQVEEMSEKSYVKTSRQFSDLSFQCYGENFLDEAAWMSPRARQKPNLSMLMPPLTESRVESWLSGTSSALGAVLATATPLMPQKASLVETPSPKKPSLTSFPFPNFLSEFPPRNSSLSQVSVLPTPIPDMLVSTTPPLSDNVHASPKRPQLRRTTNKLRPQHSLDIAMATPPESPMTSTPPPFFDEPALHNIDDLGISIDGPVGDKDDPSHRIIQSKHTENNLISDLEDEISAFPHMMPDISSPLIAALESRVKTQVSGCRFRATDVSALHRVFPESTSKQRFALYAYILGRIYLDTLLPADHTTGIAVSGGSKWRDTPLWGSSSPTRYNRRLRGVQSDLLRCIHSLMRRMEDPAGFDEGRCESEYTITTLRMLEEIVRCC